MRNILRSLLRLTSGWCLFVLLLSHSFAQPGTPLPATLTTNDQKPGSVLFFSYVTSNASHSGAQNTMLAFTNTNTIDPARVSYFFINGQTGTVAQQGFVCLVASQTVSLRASDIAPNVTGYVLAVVVDSTGLPLSFNYLLGNAAVKTSSGHKASLNAEAFAALYSGSLPGTTTATLAFDGVSYNAAPRALALGKVNSPADGNQSQLIINRFGGDLTSGVTSAGAFFGRLFDDTPTSYNFAFSGPAQFSSLLNDSFPLLAPTFSNVLSSGRYGALQCWATEDVAILGAALNYNATAPFNLYAFTGGQNLHKLTLTTSASFVIPLSTPPC